MIKGRDEERYITSWDGTRHKSGLARLRKASSTAHSSEE